VPFDPDHPFSQLKRAPILNFEAYFMDFHLEKNGYVPFLIFMCRFSILCAVLNFFVPIDQDHPFSPLKRASFIISEALFT
jgi:hypothetical protein